MSLSKLTGFMRDTLSNLHKTLSKGDETLERNSPFPNKDDHRPAPFLKSMNTTSTRSFDRSEDNNSRSPRY